MTAGGFTAKAISTHTPREGSDDVIRYSTVLLTTFQPTLPVRGVTLFECQPATEIDISTHTPREGSDLFHFCIMSSLWNFNPHSP